MARPIIRLLAAFGVAAIASTVHADIVNPSFEILDADYRITGWNALDDPSGIDLPWAEGTFWATQPNPGAGALAATMGVGRGGQTVTLNAGDVILFEVSAATPPGPYGFWYDDYRIQVWLCEPDRASPLNHASVFDASTPTQFNMYWPNNTPLVGQWITGSLIVPATGTYTLGFQGTAGGPVNETMWVMLDNFRVVPAPGAAALLGLGGLLATRRR
ncbi:MAG: hypothetical protein K2X32_04420 [Phycisphaerales bacterium]|nr:hypothetical protein [Phycisphaerales bacterium]